VFYQANCTQATKITPSSDGVVPSAAAWRCLQRARYNSSCSRTDHSVTVGEGWRECAAHFVPGDLDIQTRPSEGPKHIFDVNMAQISSAVPEIFDSQTNKQTRKVTYSAKNRTLRSSMRLVVTDERWTLNFAQNDNATVIQYIESYPSNKLANRFNSSKTKKNWQLQCQLSKFPRQQHTNMLSHYWQVAQQSQRGRATHELLRFAKLPSGIFEPPFGGLRGKVGALSIPRWKAHDRLPISDKWTFS